MAKLTIAFVVDSVPFTRAVIAGETSLGGSESACIGLARALAGRGHRVQIFTTRLDPDAVGRDHAGVIWRSTDEFRVLNTCTEWDVCVALRTVSMFASGRVNARLRILWTQDLLTEGPMAKAVMAAAWQIDRIAYVSDFHRRQWEEVLPSLSPVGWVTRNGFDPARVPTDVAKDPTRIIHISRPERGLRPLLQMWPTFRSAHPEAELRIARYSSMYDPEGWGVVCASFDREVARLQREVGGIVQLGELGKADLYRELAAAAVMWYPGVATFAETSCIAAIEAQACGTPIVASYKGALPETAAPANREGYLIRGDADDEAYQRASMREVANLLHLCKVQSPDYADLQDLGRLHVADYDYATIAGDWEFQIASWFDERFYANLPAVLRQLLHEDDHVAARQLALTHGDQAAVDWCDHVIAGKDHTDVDYAERSVDALAEARGSERFRLIVPHFVGARRVLDVACGNGAFAIALAEAYPDVHVVGLDYAAGNIAKARAAAAALNLQGRLTFVQLAVYDFATQGLTPAFDAFAANAHPFDACFVGEFLEHCAGYQALIDGLETALVEGAPVVYTVPNGAFAEIVPRGVPLRRGHVHRFTDSDLEAVFGPKAGYHRGALQGGLTPRGNPIGNWIVRYTTAADRPAGARPLDARIVRTRPYVRLSVGLITKNTENDLARCLSSVWALADEIVIGDTGSTDTTKAIAAQFGARVLDLPAVEAFDDGFAGARNAVLDACTGEWFLWIDADEVLIGPEELRKFLETAGPYRGFVLQQHHLALDQPPSHDIPIRLFKREPSIRFFGCVHEQPGDGDANTDIVPTLHLSEAPTLVHTGQLTEALRYQKMLHRNLPLLARDRERFPDRRLGHVLVLRDYLNLADVDRQSRGGAMTPTAVGYYRQAIALFRAELADPTDKYHDLARPYYDRAMRALGEGFEVEIALAGRRGAMGEVHATPLKTMVGSADEFERLVHARLTAIRAQIEPRPLRVDPFEDVLARPLAEATA